MSEKFSIFPGVRRAKPCMVVESLVYMCEAPVCLSVSVWFNVVAFRRLKALLSTLLSLTLHCC